MNDNGDMEINEKLDRLSQIADTLLMQKQKKESNANTLSNLIDRLEALEVDSPSPILLS